MPAQRSRANQASHRRHRDCCGGRCQRAPRRAQSSTHRWPGREPHWASGRSLRWRPLSERHSERSCELHCAGLHAPTRPDRLPSPRSPSEAAPPPRNATAPQQRPTAPEHPHRHPPTATAMPSPPSSAPQPVPPALRQSTVSPHRTFLSPHHRSVLPPDRQLVTPHHLPQRRAPARYEQMCDPRRPR